MALSCEGPLLMHKPCPTTSAFLRHSRKLYCEASAGRAEPEAMLSLQTAEIIEARNCQGGASGAGG